jgi:hypothetical protein
MRERQSCNFFDSRRNFSKLIALTSIDFKVEEFKGMFKYINKASIGHKGVSLAGVLEILLIKEFCWLDILY